MSSKEPLFSFVLPAYKAQFLREAIESILNQTYQNFELVIVDDASPEDLKSIVNTFSDTRLKYYRNDQNIGGSDLVKQWNHCLTFAQGDYVILAADDDVYNKDFLSEAVALFSKYPEVQLLRARTQSIDENGSVLDIDIKCAEYMEFGDFLLLRGKIHAGIGNYVFKRSKLYETKFISFPLAWWSDWATAYEHALKGVIYTQKILFSFRSSGSRVSSQHDKKNILQKIVATKSFFSWLMTKLDEAKQLNPMDIRLDVMYHFFFQANHLCFMDIVLLMSYLGGWNFWWVLFKIKKMKIISRREFIKLIYFQFNNAFVKIFSR